VVAWDFFQQCVCVFEKVMLVESSMQLVGFYLICQPVVTRGFEHCNKRKQDTQLHLFEVILYFLQVVPGRAGGGSFKRKKNYIAKKEFAYRMCAR